MPEPAKNHPKAEIVAMQNVGFDRGETPILTDIDWRITAGSCAAVLGPNGCGKSTLLRLAAGYLWASRGSISLFGCRLGEHPLQELRQRLALVEAVGVYPFDRHITVSEVVCTGFFGSLTMAYAQPSAAQLAATEAIVVTHQLQHLAQRRYHTLSTGERMRTLLARATVHQPELLLLDEPTSGLDLPARESLLAALANLHAQPNAPAIVMVTHHLEDLPPATSHVLLLGPHGILIAQGEPAAVLTRQNLTAAYEWPMTPVYANGRFSISLAAPQAPANLPDH